MVVPAGFWSLSGTGNLRALVAGLVLTLIAQASLTGIFSFLRAISTLWLVGPSSRDMALAAYGIADCNGSGASAAGLLLAWRSKSGLWIAFGAFMTLPWHLAGI
ncbi:MAG: hypothetical protein R3D34_04845 [Nitratireductor sp.]